MIILFDEKIEDFSKSFLGMQIFQVTKNGVRLIEKISPWLLQLTKKKHLHYNIIYTSHLTKRNKFNLTRILFQNGEQGILKKNTLMVN